MKYGLGPTIVSIVFILIISMVYLSKEKIDNIENKLYKMIVLNSFLFCISNILYVISLNTVKYIWINIVIWRIYEFLFISLFEFIAIFLIVHIRKIRINNFKELKKKCTILKSIVIIFRIVKILLLIKPYNSFFEVFDKNNIVFTTKGLSIISVFMIMFIGIIVIKEIYNNKDKHNNETIKNLILILFCFTIIIIQIMYPNLSTYSLLTTIITTIIYLSFTNPDIEISRRLSNAQNIIEKNSKIKTNFLTNITTEIKMPVSYISSLCTNLENFEVYNEENIKTIMKHIIISGNNLLDIVNNVLDISKLESGKISVSESVYNMNKLVDEVISNAKTKLGEKNIKFILKISPTLSQTYKGDVIKIYQILTNIISNSIKYTNVGKIILEITNTKTSMEDKILFKITDTGEGISEEEQSKILNKIDEKDEDSHGYGLSIAKEYTELLNGQIWFKSEFKVGTTFFVEIPQEIVSSEQIKETSKIINIETEKSNYTNLVALVVDDNKLNTKVVKRVLERYGFTVVTAASGQECIYKIKSEEHFDIIFMDQVMEEMSGIETMKALKNLTEYNIPPIVSLTANALSGMKELYLEEGFDAYLAKPINTLALEEVLKKIFTK